RRIFKSAAKTSPIKYINYLRLEKAKNLLSESSLKVSEIAVQVGFSDSFYFSRLFKKETGVSPASFKKNIS
ncbi:MAG: helix-turn-helix transcriptional regulator, partial [Clostridia bacterium]|nr:helix-turn-helix transcriptional regulator [Clostridia bacterium]